TEGDSVPVTVTGAMGTKLITGTDHIRVKRGKINNPHAGVTLVPGQMTSVQWTTPSGVHAQWIAVLHSLDKGATWVLDTARLPNSGQFMGHVPYALCDSATV